MDVKSLLQSLNLKEIPCEYCDLRVEETYETNIRINNREVTTAIEQSSKGAFLRLRKNGQWYYSATTDLTTLREQLMALADSPDLGDPTKWNRLPENNGTFENISTTFIPEQPRSKNVSKAKERIYLFMTPSYHGLQQSTFALKNPRHKSCSSNSVLKRLTLWKIYLPSAPRR